MGKRENRTLAYLGHLRCNLSGLSRNYFLNNEIPSVVHASSVFANLELPQHSVSFIGSTEYRLGDIQPNQPFLDIEANVIFGQLKVIKTE